MSNGTMSQSGPDLIKVSSVFGQSYRSLLHSKWLESSCYSPHHTELPRHYHSSGGQAVAKDQCCHMSAAV